jgi:hypothetical protein
MENSNFIPKIRKLAKENNYTVMVYHNANVISLRRVKLK